MACVVSLICTPINLLALLACMRMRVLLGLQDLDLCNEDITRKELRLAFLQARAVVPDNVKDRARSITLSSLDFLEALVRLARVTGSENTPLHMRVDELASRVLMNFDSKWGDGDGRITLADFDKQTNRRHKASRRLSKH